MPVHSEKSEEARRDRRPPCLASMEAVTVVLVGAGMLGQPVAQALALSRVRRFLLIDPDVLMPSDGGKSLYPHAGVHADPPVRKVEALRDLLLTVNPDLEVETHACRFRDFPGGRVLDRHRRGEGILPVIAVDNRFAMRQCASFFQALGLETWIAAMTPDKLQYQIFRLRPGSGCPACEWDRNDYAILNWNASCLAGNRSPESGVTSLYSLAMAAAGDLVNRILEARYPELSRRDRDEDSESVKIVRSTAPGEIHTQVRRSRHCDYHFGPFPERITLPGRASFRRAFESAAELLHCPVDSVRLGFEWQEESAAEGFIRFTGCAACASFFRIPRNTGPHPCPKCGRTGYLWALPVPYHSLTAPEMGGCDSTLSLESAGLRDGFVFRAEDTRTGKQVLIQIEGEDAHAAGNRETA